VLLIALAPILVPLIIFWLLAFAVLVPVLYLLLYFTIWLCWVTRGRDILFVYSDSPVWRDYMLSEMLPLVENRAQMGMVVFACSSIQILLRKKGV
jgi:hypothetical protein